MCKNILAVRAFTIGLDTAISSLEAHSNRAVEYLVEVVEVMISVYVCRYISSVVGNVGACRESSGLINSWFNLNPAVDEPTLF